MYRDDDPPDYPEFIPLPSRTFMRSRVAWQCYYCGRAKPIGSPGVRMAGICEDGIATYRACTSNGDCMTYDHGDAA